LNKALVQQILELRPSHLEADRIRIRQIVGDVVNAIGGELVEVIFLIPTGTDPHAYEPAPQDAVHLAEADMVFINGFGLEQNLEPLLADFQSKLVNTSEGIQPLTLVEAGESGLDPHVWMNPQNVEIWADNISEALAEIDPSNAAGYQQNAEAYKGQLEDLESWALDQINQIPDADRPVAAPRDGFLPARHQGVSIRGQGTPIDDLWMCGSGTHPGGGIMGAPGALCAKTMLDSRAV
jgi:ABC-type Zn uptake system ZnuABC Zn-binding protein ZnuA